MCILTGFEIMHPFHLHIGSLIIEAPLQGEICLTHAALTKET